MTVRGFRTRRDGLMAVLCAVDELGSSSLVEVLHRSCRQLGKIILVKVYRCREHSVMLFQSF